MTGLLLVDKPSGPTSHDVVAFARRELRERRIGHTGTLDPQATGLLVLCVGEATKLVPYLTAVDKTYEAVFELGVATSTEDADGTVVATAEVPEAVRQNAVAAVLGLVGELQLAPPAFSAIHVGQERAHERARRGEVFELPTRTMTVRSVSGARIEERRIWATIEVTKGTYIRSLATELGRRLGVPAHLAGLRRIACGAYRVEDPRCVTGLRVGWRDRPDGSRGARVESPAGVPGGPPVEGSLRERLWPASEAVVGPRLAVPVASPEEPLVEGLWRGKRARLEPELRGWTRLPVPGEWVTVYRGPVGSEGVVVCRAEATEEASVCLQPERVIVPFAPSFGRESAPTDA